MVDHELTTPIFVAKRRSRSLSQILLQWLAVVVFLGLTLSTVAPIGRRSRIIAGEDHRGGCEFPAIFNFGDSNSDTGAKSAAFGRIPYPNGESFFNRASGRYCDGKIILDLMAEKLGLPYLSAYLNSMGANFRHGANFAVGGAMIQRVTGKIFDAGYSPFALKFQLTQFKQFKARTEELFDEDPSLHAKTNLPRPEDFSKALYTLDIGQNDLDFGLNSMTTDALKASLPSIISVLAQTIKGLYEQGGRTFWIHNTGPIGCLPNYLMKNRVNPENIDQNGCIKSYNEVAQEFNRLLKEAVFGLRVELTDATLTYVDIYSAKYSLISDAAKNGFENSLGYCCGHSGNKFAPCWKKEVVNGTEVDANPCNDPSKYVNWDSLHYTQSANTWLAQKVLDGSLSDPPIPITEVCNTTLSNM